MRQAFESLFLVAFLLYATVIISHQVLNEFRKWMGILFSLAFMADLSATFYVCVLLSAGWRWTPHSTTGVIILIIMGLHLAAYFLARKGSKKFQNLFHRISPFAGAFWVVVTVSGSQLAVMSQALIDACIIGLAVLIGLFWNRVRTS